jgi:hypothetical protein
MDRCKKLLQEFNNYQKNGVFIDNEFVSEILQEMAGSDKSAIRSYLAVIMLHMLKFDFQPEMKSSSWEASIRTSRNRITFILADSPSLKNFARSEPVLDKSYAIARNDAIKETGLPSKIFPKKLPYSYEDILKKVYKISR